MIYNAETPFSRPRKDGIIREELATRKKVMGLAMTFIVALSQWRGKSEGMSSNGE